MFKKQKTIVATLSGYANHKAGVQQVFYNLYEDKYGRRFMQRFEGKTYNYTPFGADFSVAAYVDAWLHGGSLPQAALAKSQAEEAEDLLDLEEITGLQLFEQKETTQCLA
ncbi:hypothetical protein [Bartonella sp. DGB2]|uniref:hypothetical protein n=1 Tax=Bartonella sp. DGB2 TaxID=3388426 RepID=UPI0039902B07